ncbi:5-dehydro-4-deoxyglucarate dehydratase [Lichenicoccus sp.]|uniref:5-dehydro-4-deoxyglucarate dehydratase n=1 Tax=Lichenicoccus sp. TaxID=2781899 RepID=UPI003D14A301
MSTYNPQEMAAAIGSGLLSFPVSHFDDRLALDLSRFREHLGVLLEHRAAGLFAAGGTGEFFSLTPGEVALLVKATVEEVGGKIPVIAPAGYGTVMASELARSAEEAGADGILLLPPYLTDCDASGLADHVARVCAATRLGVIFYSRANAKLDDTTLARLADRCPNLVGFKDGVGDIEMMTRIYARLGDRFTYVGGLPTAETFALPYLEMGVTTYSSAIFNFMPVWAQDFYAAVRRRDHATVYQELRDFVLPYIALRNRRKGYAVSIVKAGMRVIGRPAGPVRSPLTDLTSEEFETLSGLIGSRS